MVDKLGLIIQFLERVNFNTLHQYQLRIYTINYDITHGVWSTYYVFNTMRLQRKQKLLCVLRPAGDETRITL